MTTRRGKYQGVFQIVRFNWPMYLVAAVILIVGTVLATIVALPELVRAITRAGLGLAGFWLILSLLVSHYVYDRSALYRAEWLRRIFPSPPPRYATLLVGLDEFSEILRKHFPQSQSVAVDFFEATEMTEPSIRRARQETPPHCPRSSEPISALFHFATGNLTPPFSFSPRTSCAAPIRATAFSGS